MSNNELTHIDSTPLPDIQKAASVELHKRNISQAKQQMEQYILTNLPQLLQVQMLNALPHETLYLRVFNDEGSFIYEKRVTDPIQIQYIKENKDRKLWRTDYYEGNPDLAERLTTRLIGAPKTTAEVNFTQDSVNTETQRKTNDALDAFLRSQTPTTQKQ